MKVGAEVARALADLGHPLAEQRAGRLAGREHEVGDPDLARQLAAAERLAALVGEREGGRPPSTVGDAVSRRVIER